MTYHRCAQYRYALTVAWSGVTVLLVAFAAAFAVAAALGSNSLGLLLGGLLLSGAMAAQSVSSISRAGFNYHKALRAEVAEKRRSRSRTNRQSQLV